jgi:hypothetical protein
MQGAMEQWHSLGGAVVDLVRSLANLDDSPELHAARLLVLLSHFAGKSGDERIEGLTKLAKLDFLLRYPVMLERALRAKGRRTSVVNTTENERYSVESEMVRYRFGPWDHRYRALLNLLVAKQLAQVSIEGRTIAIGLTSKGLALAQQLSSRPDFQAYSARSGLLRRHFDMTATNLMKFIYETFPELLDLKSNSPIRL